MENIFWQTAQHFEISIKLIFLRRKTFKSRVIPYLVCPVNETFFFFKLKYIIRYNMYVHGLPRV